MAGISAIPTLSGAISISASDVLSGELFSPASLSGELSISNTSAPDIYVGDYSVTPSAHEDEVLETQNKFLTENVTVQKIPCFVTTNPTGETVYIASEV